MRYGYGIERESTQCWASSLESISAVRGQLTCGQQLLAAVGVSVQGSQVERQHAVDAFPSKFTDGTTLSTLHQVAVSNESVVQTSWLCAVHSAGDECADEVFVTVVGGNVQRRVAVLVDAVDLAAWRTKIMFRNGNKTNVQSHYFPLCGFDLTAYIKQKT